MCPWASITAWQRRLMLFTSRLIVCWGMASHSSWRAALRSLRFWGAEFQASTRWLSWSHRFSMGFRSGESAGHSIWGTPVSNSRSLMMLKGTWRVIETLTFFVVVYPPLLLTFVSINCLRWGNHQCILLLKCPTFMIWYHCSVNFLHFPYISPESQISLLLWVVYMDLI